MKRARRVSASKTGGCRATTPLCYRDDPMTDPRQLLERLEEEIRNYSSICVAFSGGVDSGLLAGVAVRVLGDRAVAVTADSPSMARRELRAAEIFAREIGIAHIVEQTDELANADYSRNDTDRCFHCKHTLFELCESVAAREELSTLAYGYTLDDVGDFRPGARAAAKFGVVAPLRDAGFGKEQIRAVAAHLGYELWDKPAAPCLASRVPYGSEVTSEKLGTIEQMEDLLHELGFRIFRARFDGSLMRIECAEEEISRLVAPDVRRQLLDRAAGLGVPLLTVDLEGFRSGKLNRAVLR